MSSCRTVVCRAGDSLTAFSYYHRCRANEELLDQLNQIEKMKMGYFVGLTCCRSYLEKFLRQFMSNTHFQCYVLQLVFLQVEIKRRGTQCIEIIHALQQYYSNGNSGSANLRNKILGEIEIINIFLFRKRYRNDDRAFYKCQ